MGTVYFIRHGARFPLKIFPEHASKFGDESVMAGELTNEGRTQMRQLGVTFKDVPIVKAISSNVSRCRQSLAEFLKGANCQVELDLLADVNFNSLEDYFKASPPSMLASALSMYIRNRAALDALNDKISPKMEKCLSRDILGGTYIDSLAVLSHRGLYELPDVLAELDFDFAMALATSLRSGFDKAIRRTAVDALKNQTGHTVALVSDIHILFVLQRVAPQLIGGRPPFATVLKMTHSNGRVDIFYRNERAHMSMTEFQERIARDLPAESEEKERTV